MVQMLLQDVMVLWASCKRSIKAIEYDTHCCGQVSRQLVSKVVGARMLGANKENCIRIPTGGTVNYTCKMNMQLVFIHSISIHSLWHLLVHVTAPTAPLSDLSVHTCKCCVCEFQKTHKYLSVSSRCSEILLQDEIKALIKEEKQQLLHDAGITADSWASNDVHAYPSNAYTNIHLYMWLKQYGAQLGSEKKHVPSVKSWLVIAWRWN